jgi:non-ribosomal peptide synthetase component F
MPVLDTKKDLSALFSLQVQATPDAIALEDDKTTYTYAELDQKVEHLAHALRSHGVKRDSLVGVLLPRSADYIIACLAALRAGGAFLVLELAYPPELLTDTAPKLESSKKALHWSLLTSKKKARLPNPMAWLLHLPILISIAWLS